MADRIREAISVLRTEADDALVVPEAELRKSEEKLWEYKQLLEGQEASTTTNEGLIRKIRLLEEDLDAAGRQLIETVDRLRAAEMECSHWEASYKDLLQQMQGP
ncbi:hypothetical protein AB1N83_012384 [Pleurotus pulmonarius]